MCWETLNKPTVSLIVITIIQYFNIVKFKLKLANNKQKNNTEFVKKVWLAELPITIPSHCWLIKWHYILIDFTLIKNCY